MKNTIAIQGIKGSFHHCVAERYFNDDNAMLECMTFDALVDSLLEGRTNVAVMAIENFL